jgi:hypothetical protein
MSAHTLYSMGMTYKDRWDDFIALRDIIMLLIKQPAFVTRGTPESDTLTNHMAVMENDFSIYGSNIVLLRAHIRLAHAVERRNRASRRLALTRERWREAKMAYDYARAKYDNSNTKMPAV